MKQKKGEIYKMRNHFSRHRKTKHTKKYFYEAQHKRKQKSRSFLMEKRREKGFFFLQKPEKRTFLWHKEFDIKKHGNNKEQKKEV